MKKLRLAYSVVFLTVLALIVIFVSYAFMQSYATSNSISGEVFEAQVKFNGSDDINIENIGPVLGC